MTDTRTAPTAVDAGPFNDSLTKPQLIEHLRDVHQVYRLRAKSTYGWSSQELGPNTKVTKDTMLKHHAKLHEFLDAQTDQWWIEHPEGSDATIVSDAGYTSITVPARHTHSEIVTAARSGASREELEERAQRILAGEVPDKPMPAAERSVVKQLIDNEFGTLKQQMRELAADTLRGNLEQVEADWKDRRAAAHAYETEYKKILRKAEAKIESLKAKGKAAGVTVKANEIRRYMGVHLEFEGYEKAKKAAQDENKTALDRALMTLERQRLAAQQKVLMAGLSQSAADLLNSVPTASELMIEAQREASLAPKELEG